MTATDEANLQWGKTSDDLNIGGSYSSIDALTGEIILILVNLNLEK